MRSYLLPGSRSDELINITKLSNVGVAGKFIFRVDSDILPVHLPETTSSAQRTTDTTTPTTIADNITPRSTPSTSLTSTSTSPISDTTPHSDPTSTTTASSGPTSTTTASPSDETSTTPVPLSYSSTTTPAREERSENSTSLHTYALSVITPHLVGGALAVAILIAVGVLQIALSMLFIQQFRKGFQQIGQRRDRAFGERQMNLPVNIVTSGPGYYQHSLYTNGKPR
ncbi:uncharacterized protein [Haliotis cracherodii]|uniref:uncharacterized protein n=1 Tax=Haliotis cracherodii TaxID=6455 RepID=UPI0039E9BB2B